MSSLPSPPFASLLRQYRQAAGLTQEELAERARLSVKAIGALERGERRAPRKETIDLLAEALQLSQEERARLEAAARGRPVPAPSHPRDTPLHLVRADEEQAEQEQDGTLPLPISTGQTTPAETPGPQTSTPPQEPAPIPTRRQRKWMVLGAVALLVVLVATSSGLAYWLKLGPFGKGAAAAATCSPGYVYAQPTTRGGTITFSNPFMISGTGAVSSTNPWFIHGFNAVELADAFWGNPLMISPTGAFLPDELTEIPTQANGDVDVSQDEMTVTLRLRLDLKWSDGQPLTADDFVYWLDVFLDPATGINGSVPFDTYQAKDAHMLVLHYKQPFASYLYYLPVAAPRHAWGRIPRQDLGKLLDPDNGIYLHPEVALYPNVTSGPFKLESDVPGQSITMVPNPYYVSTCFHRSVLDKLIYTAAPPDKNDLIAAYDKGAIQFAEGFNTSDLSKMTGRYGLKVTPSLNASELDFNLGHLVLQDFQVRKAIEEAIDRCAIIMTTFQQKCEVMRSDTIIPSPAPSYDSTITPYHFDLAAARQDMAIAGWDCSSGTCTRDGKSFPQLTLVTTSDSAAAVRKQVTMLIEQDLKALGITVKRIYYPASQLFGGYNSGGILATGHYDLALVTADNSFDDDGNFYPTYHSSQIPAAPNQFAFGGNFERVSDQTLDHDLEQGRMIFDQDKRAALYKAVQHILIEKVYLVPLFLSPIIALVNPNIGNEQNHLTYGIGNLWNVGDWFLIQ